MYGLLSLIVSSDKTGFVYDTITNTFVGRYLYVPVELTTGVLYEFRIHKYVTDIITN